MKPCEPDKAADDSGSVTLRKRHCLPGAPPEVAYGCGRWANGTSGSGWGGNKHDDHPEECDLFRIMSRKMNIFERFVFLLGCGVSRKPNGQLFVNLSLLPTSSIWWTLGASFFLPKISRCFCICCTEMMAIANNVALYGCLSRIFYEFINIFLK